MTAISKTAKYHILTLAVVVIISALSALGLTKLKFNYDFEAFFPNEDDELANYQQFRENFEYDNEFILIAIENKAGIFDSVFLSKINQLSNDLTQLAFIKQVQSPTNLKTLKYGGLSPVQLQLLHFESPERYQSDSAKIYNNRFLVGSFFAPDAKSISIFIKTDDILSKKKSDFLADNIQQLLSKIPFDDFHLVGRIFAQQIYLKNIQKEFIVFLSIAFVLVVFFLWLTFRRLSSVVIPVLVVLTAILWTLGCMSFLNKSIDIMAIMLPTMIFVAGMSDVVHFFSKYFEEKNKGTPAKELYSVILKEVGFPTFLTLVTTVVGFLSLLFSSIQPIRDFGIFTSIGVTIACVLSYTLLPALLYFLKPATVKSTNSSDAIVHKWLRVLFVFVLRHRLATGIVTLLLCAIAIIGITQIKINNVLLEDLNPKEKIKQDFSFLDRNFSGVRPLELEVKFKKDPGNLWSFEHLQAIHRIDSFVIKQYGAGFIISPASIARQIYESIEDTSFERFLTIEEFAEIEPILLQNLNNKSLKKFSSKHTQSYRISGKIRDMGSLNVKHHNQALQKFCNENFNNTLSITITGAAHLLDRNNEYMVANMSQGFIFSITIIALLTLILHRSLKMVLVFIIPNIVPLVIIAGIMGFAGIELKAATSLVFSIAFGIATDDTIHFISRLKIERLYGKSLLYALKRTYLETGKPILLTTFILVGGFMSLMSSNFESTFYFGFLICITVIIALIADLMLLPVLLVVIYGKQKRT